MRKILNFTNRANSALTAVSHLATLVAIGTGLAVTLCSNNAVAQSGQNTFDSFVAPAAMNSDVAAQLGILGESKHPQTVDASYSLLNDTTSTQPASFRSGPHQQDFITNVCGGPSCDVSWYANYDALWLRREGDERFSLTQNAFFEDFEYDFGGRYSVARLFNCVDAWEGVYVGPFKWNRSGTFTGAGTLQSRLQPFDGFTAASIDAFNGANVHTQNYQAELNSFELNRRWWAWDVVSTMLGVRYVDYQEDYSLTSLHGTNGVGILSERIDNRMVGAQVGADMMYPVSLRGSIGFRGKAGVFANFNEREAFISNGGNVLLFAGENDVDVAGVIEGGVIGNYQIVPSIRLTAGYEFWYMPNTATVPEQNPARFSPNSGRSIEHSDNLFLHGGSVGLQVLF